MKLGHINGEGEVWVHNSRHWVLPSHCAWLNIININKPLFPENFKLPLCLSKPSFIIFNCNVFSKKFGLLKQGIAVPYCFLICNRPLFDTVWPKHWQWSYLFYRVYWHSSIIICHIPLLRSIKPFLFLGWIYSFFRGYKVPSRPQGISWRGWGLNSSWN